MGVLIKRLSDIRTDYAEFERQIGEELSQSGRRQQEDIFACRLADKMLITKAIESTLDEKSKGNLNDIIDTIYPDDLILPTKYDDPISYAIIAGLIDQVQNTAKQLGFDQSGYGGFGCAPTGFVGAMAIPVDVDDGKDSKVFVVFESGLLTFIDGIVRLTITATPFDLLAGEDPQHWNDAWDRHKVDPNFLNLLHQTGTDLRAWISFLKTHNNRKGLAYVGMEEMMPVEASIIQVMVESAELFITAHEYVHAIMRHDDAKLDDAVVEEEADKLGALITVAALAKRPDVNMYISLAGVALALEALCINRTADDPHQAPAKRAELFLSMVNFEKASELDRATGIMSLYRCIFHDLLNFPLRMPSAISH